VRAVEADVEGNEMDDDVPMDPAKQLQQRLNDRFSSANSILRKGIRGESIKRGDPAGSAGVNSNADGTESIVAPVRAVTVAEALAQLTAKKGAEVVRLSTAMANAPDAADSDISAGAGAGAAAGGVFNTNARLRAITLTMPPSAATGTLPYTAQEIVKVISSRDYDDEDDPRSQLKLLNPSQLTALREAILRPVSLIQGPPGTGKTRTACAILATVIELMNQRMLQGGEAAKGQKSHKVG
jgi:hypothetical protein